MNRWKVELAELLADHTWHEETVFVTEQEYPWLDGTRVEPEQLRRAAEEVCRQARAMVGETRSVTAHFLLSVEAFPSGEKWNHAPR